MTAIQTGLLETIVQALQSLYGETLPAEQLTLSVTRKEFVGDFTLVCFPITKISKKKPQDTAEEVGRYLLEVLPDVADFNVIQGFLNLSIRDKYWFDFLQNQAHKPQFGTWPSNGKKVMIEFASPNTNKPLHLGHVRNILLGWSSSKILANAGYDVIRSQVINDRGIAICKSMLAWQKFGNGATPTSTGVKGDHLVGEYYVRFETEFKEEYEGFQFTDMGIAVYERQKKEGQDMATFFKEYKNKYFNEYSELGAAARQMLLRWEANDPETTELWRTMNGWVYDGFNTTYDRLGVSFDKVYYESDTYLLGKDIVDAGLANGTFYQKEDGSVWIDLTADKLDHKIVLRADGTSVYITQDLGMARTRHQEFGMDRSIYVVADEQEYHFQVLFAAMRRLGDASADSLYHLSYGMVELTTGRMKSREGTVVDADDLMTEVQTMAAVEAEKRGELSEIPTEERAEIAYRVGMGALKYYILKVNPKKRMIFNPEDSLDLQGHTGPYIQYAYVRMLNVLRKAGEEPVCSPAYSEMQPLERTLVTTFHQYPGVCLEAAEQLDPSVIANYLFEIAKLYSQFYHDLRILQAESKEAKQFRLYLTETCSQIIAHGMDLLGIPMPNRM